MPSPSSSFGQVREPLLAWAAWLRQSPHQSSWQAFTAQTAALNPWFEEPMVRHAVEAWSEALSPTDVEAWLTKAEDQACASRTSLDIGLVLPGNLPLVGLHDVLCVLVAGHRAQVKLSSDDAGLTLWALEGLFKAWPPYKSAVRVVDRVVRPDAVIATGSASTLPYFEQYFGHLPRLLRGHRNSTAIVWGDEDVTDWHGLASDVFLYYGKGCRNVSRILLPEGYDPIRLLDGLGQWEWQGQNHRYRNNLDYQMALQIIDRQPYLQNGSLVLRQNPDPQSPLGVLHWDVFKNSSELMSLIQPWLHQTQCFVGKNLPERLDPDGEIQRWMGPENWTVFRKQWTGLGQTQKPGLFDYADGIDTMEFLLKLQNSGV
ncbi:MAG: hypothetical protein EBR22_00875 [Cytophagia bacterium]|nr:hypothetical protein [Cytophagia bacterium]